MLSAAEEGPSSCDIMLVGRQVVRSLSARRLKDTPRRLILPGICKGRSTSNDPAVGPLKESEEKLAAATDLLQPNRRPDPSVAGRAATTTAAATVPLLGGGHTHTAAFRLAAVVPSSSRPKSDSSFCPPAARTEWPPHVALQARAACLRREQSRAPRAQNLAAGSDVHKEFANGDAPGERRPIHRPVPPRPRPPPPADGGSEPRESRALALAGEPIVQNHRSGANARSALRTPLPEQCCGAQRAGCVPTGGAVRGGSGWHGQRRGGGGGGGCGGRRGGGRRRTARGGSQ